MIAGPSIALASSSAAGTALNTSTTQTSILHASGLGTIPGGTLSPGSIIRATVRGIISTLSSAPGTITFGMKIGSATVSALGASATLGVSATNVTFELVIESVVRSVGSGTNATIVSTARAQAATALGGQVMFPATGAPTAGTGFDSTISNAIDITAQWSVSSASNSIQVQSSLIEVFQ